MKVHIYKKIIKIGHSHLIFMATILMRLESRNVNGLNAKIMIMIIRRIKNNNKLSDNKK